MIHTVVTSKFGFFQKNLVKKKSKKGWLTNENPQMKNICFQKKKFFDFQKKVFDFQKKVLFSKKSFLFFHYL